MSSLSENGDTIRRYLLGELAEQEREQVEQDLMSDDQLYQRLLLTEDDLIDDYISGTLSGQDQAKFSQRFLQIPELRQDVRSIMALRKHALATASHATRDSSPASPPFSLIYWLRKFFTRPIVAFAAVFLTAILVIVWLAAKNIQLRKQVDQLQAQQQLPTSQSELREALAAERLRNEQLSAEFLRQQELLAEESRKLQEIQEPHPSKPNPKPDSHTQTPVVFAFTLGAGAMRESGVFKKVSVPPGALDAKIRLDLASADYHSYRAVLKTVEGREVLSRQGLRVGRGMFVQLQIPAKSLTPGDYQIQLSGINPSGDSEELDNYYFRVLK